MEQEFEAFMQQLQPNAGYMRLYRQIVLDVWRKKKRQPKGARRFVAQGQRAARKQDQTRRGLRLSEIH
jgi:hypothetical protein